MSLQIALIVVSFLVSFAVTVLVISSGGKSITMFADHDFSGPQKFHAAPVPRVGGISIAVALLASVILMQLYGQGHGKSFQLLLACAAPAFAAGLVEDLTKRVPPRIRLMFVAISACMGIWLLKAVIPHTGVPGLDILLGFAPFAAVFTVFAVAGVANAVNIIDGFNGLASMCVMIMLAALSFVAFSVGDRFVGTAALLTLGAVLGFFVLNFPGGLIFLGDGGAYLLGFLFAELSLLLVARNPSVSAFFPFLLCAYPIFETIFSVYRRKMLRGISPSEADGLHLHSLVYRRLMRWPEAPAKRNSTARNSMTSPYLWLLCLSTVIPAVLNWDSPGWLVFYCLAFALAYVMLYWRIVRFKSPKWMVLRRQRG